tara:strand:+ start:22522 stop:23295 length:774 start_codon:yes stop_codon:yes gene_type:complete
MLLTIDIGNTSIAVGIFNQKDLNATFRIATDRDNFPDEYGSLLLNLLRSANIAVDEITAAVISSTVPGLTTTFQEVCEKYFQVKPVIVGAGIKTGINILYENPKEVGPDRILHVVAGLSKYEPPLVIVDLGTACVFDAVSADGSYLGGAIAPGIGLASNALVDHAAMLHTVEFAKPSGVIGRNTVHSMQAGIYFGYVEMVEGMINRFKSELTTTSSAVTVLATGGYSSIVAADVSNIDHIEADLNLEGLRLVYEANK